MKPPVKSSVIVILLCWTTVYLPSCMKEVNIPSVTTTNVSDITQTSVLIGGNVINNGGAEVTTEGICWSKSEFPTINDEKTTFIAASVSFTINITGLHPGTLYFARAFATNSAGMAYGNRVSFTTQGPGTEKSGYPGGAIYGAAGFSIGSKVYLGFGFNEDGELRGRGFWEYDPTTDEWTRKADFGGTDRGDAVGFSIGNKGYIGTGWNGNSNSKDFWEYDQATDRWTKKADFGGSARSQAVGFSIGNKGYIGLGWDGGNYDQNDFWEYDPETDIWSKKADFVGIARTQAVGFSIGNKGYIGTGATAWSDDFSKLKDFWEYDQLTNVWIKKADFEGSVRYGAVGFSIGNKGYIGTGSDQSTLFNDFWEWDQSTNTWKRKADFDGTGRVRAVGFSIGNKGFVGTGFGSVTLSDFWQYDPTIN